MVSKTRWRQNCGLDRYTFTPLYWIPTTWLELRERKQIPQNCYVSLLGCFWSTATMHFILFQGSWLSHKWVHSKFGPMYFIPKLYSTSEMKYFIQVGMEYFTEGGPPFAGFYMYHTHFLQTMFLFLVLHSLMKNMLTCIPIFSHSPTKGCQRAAHSLFCA